MSAIDPLLGNGDGGNLDSPPSLAPIGVPGPPGPAVGWRRRRTGYGNAPPSTHLREN